MRILQENLENKRIVAIDFDGTITETNEFPNIGKARKDASFYINKWKKEGFIIIIWTCRSEPDDLNNVRNFLLNNNIPYDYINENYEEMDFKPYPKIFYNYLLDDRTIPRFPGFEEADRLIYSNEEQFV